MEAPVGIIQRTSGPVCWTIDRNEMNTFQMRNGMAKPNTSALTAALQMLPPPAALSETNVHAVTNSTKYP